MHWQISCDMISVHLMEALCSVLITEMSMKIRIIKITILKTCLERSQIVKEKKTQQHYKWRRVRCTLQWLTESQRRKSNEKKTKFENKAIDVPSLNLPTARNIPSSSFLFIFFVLYLASELWLFRCSACTFCATLELAWNQLICIFHTILVVLRLYA